MLDLSQIHLGYDLPREIELLVYLKYLAVLGEMVSIPSSIGNLSNLETFLVQTVLTSVSLPDTKWYLRKLRHLHIKDEFLKFGFQLPTDNLDN